MASVISLQFLYTIFVFVFCIFFQIQFVPKLCLNSLFTSVILITIIISILIVAAINAMLPVTVENLAYKKDSWINKKTLYKRHIRHKLPEGHADRAVDGDLDLRLQSCTILDNLYGKYPLWTVDLGHKTTVSGVVIYTWQGDGQGKSYHLTKLSGFCCVISL